MLRTLALAAIAALSLATAAAAQAPAAKPIYVFLYMQGPNWQAGKPMMQQPLGPHGAYIRKLLADGKLLAGGPMLDVNGGMAMVRVDTAEEAKAILAADPAITSGVFVGEVRTWLPAYDAGKPLKP